MPKYNQRTVAVVDDPNQRCWHYDAIDKMDNVTCPNCDHWGWTRCKDEVILMNRINETERLMSHDGYRRSSGGIRQTRRGS